MHIIGIVVFSVQKKRVFPSKKMLKTVRNPQVAPLLHLA